jgi:hypothetical protein
MKPLRHGLLVFPLLLVASVELAAQDKLKETPCYPLQVGTVWHYRAGEGKFTIHVVKQEKVGDSLCALLEARRDGKAIGAEHLAVAAGGIYRHDLTRIAGAARVHTALKPPLLILMLPLKKGATWKVDSTREGQPIRGEFRVDEEEITVPAGKYKTFRVRSMDFEINALKATITTHFAEGVGMVKQVTEIGDARIVIELERFEAGGKK